MWQICQNTYVLQCLQMEDFSQWTKAAAHQAFASNAHVIQNRFRQHSVLSVLGWASCVFRKRKGVALHFLQPLDQSLFWKKAGTFRRQYTAADRKALSILGWYSRVTEGRTKSLIDDLAKQVQHWSSFIVLWRQNRSFQFQTPHSCQFSNRPFSRSSPMSMKFV